MLLEDMVLIQDAMLFEEQKKRGGCAMILDQMGAVTVQSRRMSSGVSGVVWYKGHEESIMIF